MSLHPLPPDEAPPTARRFPFHTAEPASPAADYAELRAHEPVARVILPTGDRAWLVTRHEDVRKVCTDPRFSKHAMTLPDAPRLLPVHQASRSLVTLDPPEHTALRALVSKAFTPRRVEVLRPRIQEITDGLVDRMIAQGAPADGVTGLALPLPITVICELLGVPVEDQTRFRGWADRILDLPGPGADAAPIRAAAADLGGYLAELARSKRADPGPDLLTDLVVAHDQQERLTSEELREFAMTLLVAGYHTTTAAICHALIHLLGDRTRFAALVDRPDTAAVAVDELLRFSQVASGFGAMRMAQEDVELGGVVVGKGDVVIPAFGSANRDSEVFPDADRLDLERQDNPHLAFGAGAHYCLGAQLARLELGILLGTLARRTPALALAEAVPQASGWLLRTAFPRPVALSLTW
jgi:cytochrome P450